MAHTPGPWGVRNYPAGYSIVDTDAQTPAKADEDVIAQVYRDRPSGKDDAQHIVKCVNNHDALVAMLSVMTAWARPDAAANSNAPHITRHVRMKQISKADALLAKCQEGGENAK